MRVKWGSAGPMVWALPPCLDDPPRQLCYLAGRCHFADACTTAGLPSEVTGLSAGVWRRSDWADEQGQSTDT